MTPGLLPSSSPMLTLLHDLIHQHTGFYFEDGQRDRLAEKLAPLVLEHGLESFLDYYYLLKYNPDAEREWRRVESALAVNETYFWREFDQIRAAVNVIVPDLLSLRPDQPVRIWHAACASGEEPYTLAIALEEASVSLALSVEIVATDFNSEAIALARAAVYRERSFRAIPPDILQRYFIPTTDGRHRLVDSVRERVQFFHLNLMDDVQMQRMREFDIIFCRNVFIYFSTEAIRSVVERLHRSLRTPGYLFVAAAESLLKLTTLFEFSQVDNAFVYKKDVS